MAVLSVVGAWAQLRRDFGADRDRLKQELELVQLLPDDSSTRAWLLGRIDQEVRNLVDADAAANRQWDLAAIGIRLGFLALAVLFVASALTSDGSSLWLLAVAFICAIAALTGLMPRQA